MPRDVNFQNFPLWSWQNRNLIEVSWTEKDLKASDVQYEQFGILLQEFLILGVLSSVFK